ncbi:hypothetical protein HPB52_008000 [Rhipicephalus sanguineus]|uniref:SGNH hydrolase-type esterase domain-containing protein n=1 Tax=Rhipicephalus sanguineus TaxID=34632 RepID=A0A9D4PQV3_RHISA|nr:hypothetical protein HPB52_008000 [Rhipicephalus sanguineus]
MSNPASSPRVAWPRIYLFGDTLTQSSFNIGGWGSVIAEHFSRRCDVLSRGLCGYNTRAWRHALPLVLGPEDARSVAALVLMMGTSDCADPRDPEATHVPLDEYSDNVAHMLDYIQACGISYGRIILVTPPPIDEQLWLAHCRRRGVKVVDAHSHFLNDAHWSRLLSDGINLSPAGSHKLTAVLVPVLREVVGGAPRLFPEFSELDPDKPEDAISAWASETCGCARL